MGCCGKAGTLCRSVFVLVGLFGVLLSVYTAITCNFVTTESLLDVGSSEGEYGLFVYKDADSNGEECQAYDVNIVEEQELLTYARTASSLPIFIAGGAVVLQLIELVICTLCCVDRIISLAYFVAAVLQGSTFVVYITGICTDLSANCTFGEGSWSCVFAMVAYLIVIVGMCCSPRPDPCLQHRNARKTSRGTDKEDYAAGTDVEQPDD